MMRTALAVVCAASLTLGACAKVGTLERPAPLFGEKAKANYRAEKAAAAAAAKASKSDDQLEPLPNVAPSGDAPPK